MLVNGSLAGPDRRWPSEEDALSEVMEEVDAEESGILTDVGYRPGDGSLQSLRKEGERMISARQ